MPVSLQLVRQALYGDNYRSYSPDRVAAEIACVQDLSPPTRSGSPTTSSHFPAVAREFAACVERTGARVPFRMQSRCDLMTRDTVAALAHSGCVEVWMGAESGSQKILDAMEKGTRIHHIREARENLRRHGIRACFFLQFGYPGEEWDDVDATIRMVRETRPDDIGVSVSYPLPNTRFHQIVRAGMGTKANWRDSGDLAMMFQGAFSSDFIVLSRALFIWKFVARLPRPSPPRMGESRAVAMRLLLTHGFFLEEDPKEQQIAKPYPPLGILYLSAYLRARGFDVDVYDATFGSRQQLFNILDAGPPALLGIYTNLLTRKNVLAIVARAKQTGWRVVLGGPEPANYAAEYLAAGADLIVPGEGELVLEQLLNGVATPDGVMYRDASGQIVRTPPVAQIADLDTLPWPDRERIDIASTCGPGARVTAPARCHS